MVTLVTRAAQIENQTLNEKIEERNEELLKLRKKTTTTVQVLTHLKEKLQFVQAENQLLKHDLADLEVELTNKRDVLTQARRPARCDAHRRRHHHHRRARAPSPLCMSVRARDVRHVDVADQARSRHDTRRELDAPAAARPRLVRGPTA